MGTFKQGVLGGFSGKVGNVVGSSWRGIAYMRSLAQHVTNPRTAAQQSQRMKFALAMGFLQPITSYLRVGYVGYAQRRSAFNAAMSYTVSNAVGGIYPNQAIDYSKVLVSRGSLQMAECVSTSVGVGKMEFSWDDNSGQGDAQATDVAMPMVYNVECGEVVYHTSAATRAEEAAEVTTPSHWSGQSAVLFLGFVTVEGKSASNSVYLGEVTCM